MDSIYTFAELKDTLAPIFSRYGVRDAVLFGSYAKGLATKHSDVDLLVDSGLKGLAFFGLLESVVSALKIPVDLIDVSQVERGSNVEREIKESGVRIFEAYEYSRAGKDATAYPLHPNLLQRLRFSSGI